MLCWCYYGVVGHLHWVWPLGLEGWNKNAGKFRAWFIHKMITRQAQWPSQATAYSNRPSTLWSSPGTEPGPKCSLCGARPMEKKHKYSILHRPWCGGVTAYALLQPMNFHVSNAAARHSTSGITSWPARVLITIRYKRTIFVKKSILLCSLIDIMSSPMSSSSFLTVGLVFASLNCVLNSSSSKSSKGFFSSAKWFYLYYQNAP